MDRGAWWATVNGSQRVDWATKHSMLGNYKFRHDIHDSYQVKGSKYTHEHISPMSLYANTTGSWNNYYCKNKLATENRNLKFSSLKCFKHFFFFFFFASQVVLVVKNLSANAGDIRDMGLIPGSGRASGSGHGNPLLPTPTHSCLKNPMDRGTWWATVHGIEKNQTQMKQLNTNTFFS